MRPRERVLRALNHEEPDMVPIDLGTTNVTTITVDAYKKLKKYLDMDLKSEIKIAQRDAQAAIPDEEILKLFRVDTRSVWPKRPKNWAMATTEDNTFIDEWGITRKYGGLYFDPLVFPLKEATITILDKYSWPDPDDLGRFEGLKEKAEELYRNGEYAIVVDPTGAIPFGNAQLLRGFDTFLVDLMVNQKFAEILMDKLLTFQIRLLENIFKKIGSYIDVIKVADDLGTQDSLFMSPKLYRKLIKPRHKELISFIKKNTKAKVLLHTDGAVYPLIEDFIEIGVDILNPIQVSSSGMGPSKLKKEFGNQLCFWGAIDTQRVLPHGTTKDVEEEVKRRIDELAPGGGYVLASVHNIQPDVPPENICAMYRSAQKYGKK